MQPHAARLSTVMSINVNGMRTESITTSVASDNFHRIFRMVACVDRWRDVYPC
ncbi:hypothetical protein RRSWK_05165 [Rhodopirellula sp. SWK7]|nr:hypothetical protein RRSWK_05165 [Rhodopirellula sp. SWK7]